jgi:hypothetical protein
MCSSKYTSSGWPLMRYKRAMWSLMMKQLTISADGFFLSMARVMQR